MCFEDNIIVNRFSFIIRKFLNYYICVNKKSDFCAILSLTHKSFALTLTHKYKINSAAKIFKKYGKNLRVKKKFDQNSSELVYFKTLKTSILFKVKGVI